MQANALAAFVMNNFLEDAIKLESIVVCCRDIHQHDHSSPHAHVPVPISVRATLLSWHTTSPPRTCWPRRPILRRRPSTWNLRAVGREFSLFASFPILFMPRDLSAHRSLHLSLIHDLQFVHVIMRKLKRCFTWLPAPVLTDLCEKQSEEYELTEDQKAEDIAKILTQLGYAAQLSGNNKRALRFYNRVTSAAKDKCVRAEQTSNLLGSLASTSTFPFHILIYLSICNLLITIASAMCIVSIPWMNYTHIPRKEYSSSR